MNPPDPAGGPGNFASPVDPSDTALRDTAEAPGGWGELELPQGRSLEHAVGPLRLHFEERAGEVRLAYRRPDDPESELEWTRWATSDWSGRVALVPAFPDRPMVVEPEDTFWLLDGAEARIYVRVPLQMNVEALGDSGKRTLLARIPTVRSSDTWWGTVEEGELCYFLPTSARRTVTDDAFRDHLVVCPLQLMNRSGVELEVDKVALRVAYLSLFTDGGHLWADETRVRYQGEAEGSRLEMSGRPPAEAPDAIRLAEPRLKMARGFRARTFRRIRTSFQGWV